MFFKEEVVQLLMNCPGCNERYDEAKILPCGIFCKKCLDKSLNDCSEQFDCKFCQDTHLIPENGFKNYQPLEKFLSNKPIVKLDDISRGQSADNLKSSLKQIEASINEFKFEIENSEDKMKSFCLNLRNEIQLETEVLIKKIQDISESMIKEVQHFESDCLDYLNDTRLFRFKSFVGKLESFHLEWSKYLKNHEIKESETNKANQIATELKNELLNEKKYLNSFIFRNKNYRFTKNLKDIEKSIVGTIKFDDFLPEIIWISIENAQTFGSGRGKAPRYYV